MRNKLVSEFQKMIDVNIPIIYINDYDFVRVDDLIKEAIGVNKVESGKVIEWNPGTGNTKFKTKLKEEEQTGLKEFIEGEYLKNGIKKIPDYVLVLKEIHDLIDEPEIKTLLQLFAQRKLYDRDFESTIIIVDSKINVPDEISKYVSFLEIGFPDDEEINVLIDHHVKVNEYSDFKDVDRKKLMPSLQGMTAFEIDRMLDSAMSSNGTLTANDVEMILKQKKQMVKNSGVIELVDAREKIEDIGGMDYLKTYLRRKSEVYKRLPDALHEKVAVPKGVFIVGMPGCGKSLCAKASAALFECPLLKLDMGSMMGKYVGESEANLRKAIKIAEASAPCIVWIDEIEKAFSGIGGNDILTRMFGYFLSWMQDKKSAVYVIATANKADCLPPELKRKGRFDEIFCVNLPNEKEREAIFKVHLDRIGKAINPKDLNELISLTEGFNGADIEAVVNETNEDCFIDHIEFNKDSLKKKIKETVCIEKSCKKQIEGMKKQFSENCFKDASTGVIIGC